MWEAVEVSLCVTVLSMCLPHVLTLGYVTVFQSLLGNTLCSKSASLYSAMATPHFLLTQVNL